MFGGRKRRRGDARWLLACALLVVTRVAVADVCVDLDQGNSPGVKGAVEVAGSSGIPVKYWDSCSGKTLTEQVCVKDPSNVEVGERSVVVGERRTVRVECPGGCVDGACVGLQSGCVDTDKENDPLVRGIVRVYSQSAARTVTTAQPDQCAVGGRSVREYGCTGDRVVQVATRECRNGCIEGRCVNPAKSAEGCFIAVKVEEKPTSNKLGSLFKVLGVRSVVGSYVGSLIEKDKNDSAGPSLEVLDVQGKLLKRYAMNSAVYGIGEDIGKSSTVVVTPLVVREIYIPYDSLIGAARVTSPYQTLPITLNRSTLFCERECLLPNESWSVTEGTRQCCPGSFRSFYNSTDYVCVGCDSKKGKGCPPEISS